MAIPSLFKEVNYIVMDIEILSVVYTYDYAFYLCIFYSFVIVLSHMVDKPKISPAKYKLFTSIRKYCYSVVCAVTLYCIYVASYVIIILYTVHINVDKFKSW